MWNNIKRFKYLIIARYFFFGLISAIIVFQLITALLKNHKLEFNSLINTQTLGLIISGVFSTLIGGLIYIILSNYNKKSLQREYDLWIRLKENRSRFFVRNILGFSIGGFFGLLTYNIGMNTMEIENHNNFFQFLFSRENTINYVGFIIAASVFGIFFTLGLIKYLKSRYDN